MSAGSHRMEINQCGVASFHRLVFCGITCVQWQERMGEQGFPSQHDSTYWTVLNCRTVTVYKCMCSSQSFNLCVFILHLYCILNYKVHLVHRVPIKEYILVIERTAPPNVFQRCPHATSPCSVCSIERVHVKYSNYLTIWQSRRVEVGWVHL